MAEDNNEPVEIPFDDDPGKQATLLLAAAEDLELDSSEVRTTGGGFLVDPKIADKAGVAYDKGDDQDEKKPAKKTAAKKSAETKES